MTQRTCKIEGCGKKHFARGWCSMHWNRWRKHGDPGDVESVRPPVVGDTCSVEGCDRPREKKSNGTRRSMCPGHVSRKRHTGDLRPDVPIKETIRGRGRHVSSYGYWLIPGTGHPLAFANGDVLEHRAVMYDHVGPGKHQCHWCDTTVSWDVNFPATGALVVDHLNADRLNNDLSNLVVSCQPCNAARMLAGNPTDWTPSRPAA